MTETNTNGVDKATSTDSKVSPKKLVKGYIKWGLLVDLVLSIVLVVVQDTILNALAHLAHYHGVGYYLAVVGTSIVAFIINFLIGIAALIVIAGGIFVVLMLIAFFSDRVSESEEKQDSTDEDSSR